MKKEAQFLLDRLEEYDPEDEDHVRDFHGHVTPAIARLRHALADKPNPAQRKTAEPITLQGALNRPLRADR
jgi:hypothetical protein